MTTWPSASKATTTHTDSGADKPRLARTDINQNILNVNDVIDMLAIASPTNGEILVYNTSTSNFETSDNNSAPIKLTKNYIETITSLTSSTTISVDTSLASIFTVTLNHNAQFVINNLATGQSVTLIIKQDADSTANTATFFNSDSTAVKFPNGITDLSADNNAIDMVHIFNTGSDYLGTVINSFRAP